MWEQWQAAFAELEKHELLMRVATSLLILSVGIWLARKLANALGRLLARMEVDVILRSFLRNAAYVAGIVVVALAALDHLGVPTTSLLAVLGAAGLAIGLAVRDSLANIASGLMLIFLRPFRAGDMVVVAGQEGMVDQVRVFHTLLHTPDNRKIFLPNALITAAPIINLTVLGQRRIDLSLWAATESAEAIRAILQQWIATDTRVLSAPPAEIVALQAGEHGVEWQVRAWVRSDDVLAVRSELLQAVVSTAQQRGLKLGGPRAEPRR